MELKILQKRNDSETKKFKILKQKNDSLMSKFTMSIQENQKSIEDSILNGIESECLMCMDKKPCVTFFPCMHMGTCISCSKLCTSNCPICSESIKTKIFSFLV